MEEDFSNKLVIKGQDGNDMTISVLDIIDSLEFNKSFMVYYIEGSDAVYASVLNESSTTYSLDAITEQKEWDFINAQINKVVNEAGV